VAFREPRLGALFDTHNHSGFTMLPPRPRRHTPLGIPTTRALTRTTTSSQLAADELGLLGRVSVPVGVDRLDSISAVRVLAAAGPSFLLSKIGVRNVSAKEIQSAITPKQITLCIFATYV
jgi:hypothetical protein